MGIAIALSEVGSLFRSGPGNSVPVFDGPRRMKDESRIPGDFGFDPLGLKETFDFKEMQDREINNGRLAMLAWAGMVAQELATGKTLSGGGFLGKIDQLVQ